MAWLEYRLLGIHGCGNRDCYSDECCILGHEAANAKERKLKAGGLFLFWKRPPVFLIWLYLSLLQWLYKHLMERRDFILQKLLPIKEIVVAPKNHIDLAKKGMEYMIAEKGYDAQVSFPISI